MINKNIKIPNLGDVQKATTIHKPLLPIPSSCEPILKDITTLLTGLYNDNSTDCTSIKFRSKLNDFYAMFNIYQEEILKFNNQTTSCKAGCSLCCFHWVEDVNSFEAAIIADHIKQHFPDRVQDILEKCEHDSKELEKLQQLVDVSLAEQNESFQESIDSVDLLLSCFYQLRRPCPLLDNNNTCSIYSNRPMTCRIYMSFSDPLRCDPNYINDEDTPTYLMDLTEEANTILDNLHFKYLTFNDDTGLRSLVSKYLLEYLP